MRLIFWRVAILENRMPFLVSCIVTVSVIKSFTSVYLAEIKEIGGKVEGSTNTWEDLVHFKNF